MPEPTFPARVLLNLEDGSTVIVGIQPDSRRSSRAEYHIYRDSTGMWTHLEDEWVLVAIREEQLSPNYYLNDRLGHFYRALHFVICELGLAPNAAGAGTRPEFVPRAQYHTYAYTWNSSTTSYPTVGNSYITVTQGTNHDPHPRTSPGQQRDHPGNA